MPLNKCDEGRGTIRCLTPSRRASAWGLIRQLTRVPVTWKFDDPVPNFQPHFFNIHHHAANTGALCAVSMEGYVKYRLIGDLHINDFRSGPNIVPYVQSKRNPFSPINPSAVSQSLDRSLARKCLRLKHKRARRLYCPISSASSSRYIMARNIRTSP